MLYKDFFITFIDRRNYYWVNYYGVRHPKTEYVDRLPADWKYAAIAWRLEEYVRVGGSPGVIGASTPTIAYDLMKFWIDLLRLREAAKENDRAQLYRTSSESLREKRQRRYGKPAPK